jgi:hypothetical protein
MNRAETEKVILRLHFQHGLARPPTADQIDEWHRVLRNFTLDDAYAALDRLLNESKPPSLARLLTEIQTRVGTTRAEPKPIGQADCGMCDGTGWMLTRDPAEPGVDRMAPCTICRPADYERSKQGQSRHPSGGPARSVIMEGAEERKTAWRRDRGKRAATGQRYTPHNRFRDDSSPPASVVNAGFALIQAGDPDGMDVALDTWIDAGRPRDDASLAGLDLIPKLLAPPAATSDTYTSVLRRQFPKGPGLTDAEVRKRMAAIPPLPGYGANRQRPEPDPDTPPEAS